MPDDAVIITTHRSIAFYKHKAIPYEFRLFDNSFTEKGYKYYIDNILEEKPSYILYSSTELNNNRDILKNCRGKLFKQKKMWDIPLEEVLFTRRFFTTDLFII